MNTISLGHGDLRITPICLGTMTFGEQVDERSAPAILDRAAERDVNFIDAAEKTLSPGLLAAVDALRREVENPEI